MLPKRTFLILRHRWPVLAVLWAGTVAAGAVYSAMSRKIYRAEAAVEIGPEAPLLAAKEGTASALGPLVWERYFSTQMEILKSRSLHERVLKALPPAARAEFESKPDPAAAFGARLDVQARLNTLVVRIGWRDPDPKKAAEAVNALVRTYVQEATGRFGEVSAVRAGRLSQQILPELRQALDEADRKLQKFQAENGFIVFDEQYKAKLKTCAQIDDRLSQVKIKRLELQSRHEALKENLAARTAADLPFEVAESRVLQQLVLQRASLAEQLAREMVELRPEHPTVLALNAAVARVEKQIQETVQGMLRGLELDLEGKRAEEKALANELADAQARAAELFARLNQYRQLEAEWTAARDVYNSYQKSYSESMAASGTPLASIRVVDYAPVPLRHASPNFPLNLGLSFLAGALIGLLGVHVADELDNKVSADTEVDAFLGMDLLSTVPLLRREGAGEEPILLGAEAPMSELEPYRKLRIEVMARLQRLGGGKVVCVVSAVSGEGKSTTALNLAGVLGMQGLRVALVEADLRRPKLFRLLGLSGAVDLVHWLRGDEPVNGLASASSLARVHVVGTHAGTPQASEYAGSSRFYEMIEEMKRTFDVVIIDSPPAVSSAEVGVIAQRADAAVLVVREGVTRRNAALAAKRRLSGLGVKFLGTVLNCARLKESEYGYYPADAGERTPFVLPER